MALFSVLAVDDNLEDSRFCVDYLDKHDDDFLHRRYRFNKASIKKICQLLDDDVAPKDVRGKGRGSISTTEQVLIGLSYLGLDSVQMAVGDFFGRDQASVCRVVNCFTTALVKIAPDYIYFPRTELERHRSIKKIYEDSGFPGVIGIIDCTHIPISPRSLPHEADYEGSALN